MTGLGAVTPLGESFQASWEALKKGEQGTGPVTGFDAGRRPLFSSKEINRLDRFALYGAFAAQMALLDADLPGTGLEAGIVMGSSRGGVMTMEKALVCGKKISPYAMHASTVGMAASYIAQKFEIKGHSFGISSACASGMHALGEGVSLIKSGAEEVVLAGGAEAPLTRLCIEGYGRAGALSKTNSSRPFDSRRDGFVLSEGAAVLVIEEYKRAIKRKAKIYGEIVGYGNTISALHETRPDIEGEMRAMRMAIKEAGLNPDEISLIAAHATGTPLGDRAEAESIRNVFGNKVPVLALKSLSGHMLSASAPFEAAVALMCMREGLIPPYPHLKENDSGLKISVKGGKVKARYALVNSFGFGGFCAGLVLKTEPPI